jgi:methoxymalonate biosynthesis acyl carrier protein
MTSLDVQGVTPVTRTEEVSATLRTFLGSAFPGRGLGDGDDIFALGFGNSLFAMQLVEFIEHEFDVVIESEDLEIENFRSIAAIGALVGRKGRLGGGG